MLYLIDANTLINAKRDYFQMNRVPEYWAWLIYLGSENKLKIPKEIYSEFQDTRKADGSKDELAEWASSKDTKSNLLFKEAVDVNLMGKVMECYGSNLTMADLRQIGNDPFLIVAALASPQDRVVVSAEISKPSKQGKNRKVPDICDELGVQWITPFELLTALDFSTNWQSKT